MKKVLMISYFFPPTGGPCVQRTLYFAKYLPDWGYDPLVVHSAVVPYGYPEDPTLLDELRRTTCRFTGGDCGLAGSVDRVAKWLASHGRIGSGLAWRVAAGFNRFVGGVSPDPYYFWANGILEPVLRLVKRHRVDVVYSTSCPYSDHYLALRVKRRTGLPWVADFRDLWTQDKAYVSTPAHRVRKDTRLEREVLNSADAVVNVSPGYSADMRSLVPACRQDKFHVIYNGVDMSTQPEARKLLSERFVLSYIGNINTSNWSEEFLSAWRLLGQDVGRDKVLWRVAGTMTDHLRGKAEQLGDQFAFCGYQPHQRARELMSQSDALLLLINRVPGAYGIVPGKIFEYFGSGRPILCLSPVLGDSADLVMRHKAGIVANIDSVDEIYKALRTMYDAWKAGNPLHGTDPEAVRQYDRRETARQLASVFDKVIMESQSNGTKV